MEYRKAVVYAKDGQSIFSNDFTSIFRYYQRTEYSVCNLGKVEMEYKYVRSLVADNRFYSRLHCYYT